MGKDVQGNLLEQSSQTEDCFSEIKPGSLSVKLYAKYLGEGDRAGELCINFPVLPVTLEENNNFFELKTLYLKMEKNLIKIISKDFVLQCA